MAHYKQRGRASFRLTIELGYDGNGKRIKREKTIRVDEDLLERPKKLDQHLQRELLKFQTEVETGEYIAMEKLSFKEFVEVWLEKFVRKQLEATTIENYEFHAMKRIIPYFGNKQLDRITSLHVMDYLDKLRRPDQRMESARGSGALSPAYIVYNYRVLRSIFKTAIAWKVLKENPMEGVAKPKERRSEELQVYNEQEVRYIIEQLREHDDPMLRVCVLLAITTGMRRAELLGLEWKHVDLEAGVIDVRQSVPKFENGEPLVKEPKTRGSIRKIAIPPFVVEELKEFRAVMNERRLRLSDLWEGGERRFLFVNHRGHLYTPKVMTDRWRSFVAKHEKKLKYIRWHDLRHTSATLLINQGVHAKNIAARLGHSKIATTMDIYGHAIESADFAAASKFEGLSAKPQPDKVRPG